MKVEENLKKFNIELPQAPSPVGAYVAYKKINSIVYISGQVSFKSNGELIKGKLGLDVSIEQGQVAAKACAINILSQVKAACNGDLSIQNLSYCAKNPSQKLPPAEAKAIRQQRILSKGQLISEGKFWCLQIFHNAKQNF